MRLFKLLIVCLSSMLIACGGSGTGGSSSFSFLSIFAGNLNDGNAGFDGTGSEARFNNPFGVATDAGGNVYVADVNYHNIRKITPAGVVTTLAGTGGVQGSINGTGGLARFDGSDDGTGAEARFNEPYGVATDAIGNVYVADQGNHTIRKITSVGVVTTLAGTAGTSGSADGTGPAASFNRPSGVATDVNGNVFVVDQSNSTIRKITPAGVVTTLAGTTGIFGSANGTEATARFGGIATDAIGNVYAHGKGTIRKITPAGVVTTLAGTTGIFGSADGTGAAARFLDIGGIATDVNGNVFVADEGNHTIRKITPAGEVTTLAGTAGTRGSADGTGSAARFNSPKGVATDVSGNVYLADNNNDTIRKITPAGVVTTLAGKRFGADGSGAAARFHGPRGVATDADGNVYVADHYDCTIRKITPAGLVTTLAGTAGACGTADGTGAAARFGLTYGVATDADGNVYVVDRSNHTIRKITPAGVVTTLAGTAGTRGSADGTGAAARFNFPLGVATDVNGNVYVADQSNSTIRKITPSGVVTTLAGTAGTTGSADGIGAAASFNRPNGVATDAIGNVYVADHHTIRKITSVGVVTTLAGTAGTSGSADGTGAAARFYSPRSVATDTSGNVYVTDTVNSTIRKITPDGVVTTLVGTAGRKGFQPGVLPGGLSEPSGIAVHGSKIYFSDKNGIGVIN